MSNGIQRLQAMTIEELEGFFARWPKVAREKIGEELRDYRRPDYRPRDEPDEYEDALRFVLSFEPRSWRSAAEALSLMMGNYFTRELREGVYAAINRGATWQEITDAQVDALQLPPYPDPHFGSISCTRCGSSRSTVSRGQGSKPGPKTLGDRSASSNSSWITMKNRRTGGEPTAARCLRCSVYSWRL